MSFRSARESGFTLTEVLMALAIMAVAVSAISLSLTKIQEYDGLGNAQDDVLLETARTMEAIRNDLGGSAWYFPGTAQSDGISPDEDRKLQYYPFVQMQDPGGVPAALGTAFAIHQRNPAIAIPQLSSRDKIALQELGLGSPDDATTVFTEKNRAAYLQSWFARSQEIIFVCQTSGVWNESEDKIDLSQRQLPQILFSSAPRSVWRSPGQQDALKIFYPAGWSIQTDGGGNVTGYIPHNIPHDVKPGEAPQTSATLPYGVVMESGLLADPNGDVSRIEVNWQTMDGTGFQVPSSTNLKEYSYCVVPSNIGFGRLVRAVRVANATTRKKMDPAAGIWAEPEVLLSSNGGDDGMAVDRVLSDNVTRIVFDTYRTVDAGNTTVSSLDINQVKVRIYFARRSERNPDLIIRRLYETTVCLRARNSAHDKDFSMADSTSLSQRLGTAPIGLTY